MKTLLTLFTLLFGIVGYGAVPLGLVPYAQLDTNDFGVTAVGHVNTRLSIHTPNTPGDTYYLTINGTNINNGGTNFLQSLNPTAWTLPVRGADTNFVDSLLRQDATGLHMGTNFAGIVDFFGYPALTLGDTGGANTYLTLYPDGLFLKDHFGNALNLYGQTANIGGLIYAKSIMQLGTMWGKVELADDNPAHTAKFQPTLPMGTSHTTLGSSTNAWEGIYAGSTKQFQFFDVIIDPGVSTNLNFAVDGVTYNIGAGGGSVGGTTINSLDNYIPVRLNAGAFDNSPLYTTSTNLGLDSQFIFGPGTTNVLYRSGTALIYTNGATTVDGVTFQVKNGSGVTAMFGIDEDEQPFARASSGKFFRVEPDGGSVVYDFVSTGLYPDPGVSLGVPTKPWTDAYFSSTNREHELIVTNGITLGGVRATAWPSGTVTYPAVTNALGLTGSTTTYLRSDGTQATPPGGGGEWTLVAGPPFGTLLASTNAIEIGDITQTTNYITAFVVPGGPTVQAWSDGLDTIELSADQLGTADGTGLFLNGDSITPFIRTGTDITPRNAGDSVTLTGTLTVTNAAPLTTPAIEVFGGMRISRYETAVNYAISITNHMVTATADCTLTLPSAAAVGNGFQLILKAKSTVSTAVTVTPDGSDTIDGASGNATFDPLTSYIIVSDGVSDWEIIAFRIAI